MRMQRLRPFLHQSHTITSQLARSLQLASRAAQLLKSGRLTACCARRAHTGHCGQNAFDAILLPWIRWRAQHRCADSIPGLALAGKWRAGIEGALAAGTALSLARASHPPLFSETAPLPALLPQRPQPGCGRRLTSRPCRYFFPEVAYSCRRCFDPTAAVSKTRVVVLTPPNPSESFIQSAAAS